MADTGFRRGVERGHSVRPVNLSLLTLASVPAPRLCVARLGFPG